MTVTVVHTAQELEVLHDGRAIAFVPTMGALHEGHLALVRRAQELADTVVVSIFVNPLQFGPQEDFDRYPRTLGADVELLSEMDVWVFAPDVEEIYPGGKAPRSFHAGPAGENFEGAHRPGHFDGMLTVVARLCDIVKPRYAVFGQKDAQQVFLVREMIVSNQMPIVLEVVSTVREKDGLALSSRNRFLSADQRRQARVIPEAIARAQHAAQGHCLRKEIIDAGVRHLETQPLVRLDYLDLVDPTTFLSVPEDYVGPVTLIVAAKVGDTRLIDTENLEIVAHEREPHP